MLNLLEKKNNLPWLSGHQERLSASIGSGSCPHSLLIQGAAGTGKRQLALWLAAEFLGAEVARESDDEPGLRPVNPDLLCISAPYIDKKSRRERFTIGIDPVRDDLIPFISMTSHGSGGRVAIVYPVEDMTREATSSLLKTLEEPSPGSLIVLVTGKPASLLPTVVSRCQQIKLTPPPLDEALQWLSRQDSEHDFRPLLEFTGGAPLEALQLHNEGFSEFARQFLGNLARLEQNAVSPAFVASACKGKEALALRLLEWHLGRNLTAVAEQGGDLAVNGNAVFGVLGQIRELRRVINGSINAELSLAGILLDCYGGSDHRMEGAKHG